MLLPATDRAHALSMLTRPGARQLHYQLGGRSTGPSIVADPVVAVGRRSPAMSPRLTLPVASSPQPARPRQLTRDEASCPIGRV
jgi:hypothetical protein